MMRFSLSSLDRRLGPALLSLSRLFLAIPGFLMIEMERWGAALLLWLFAVLLDLVDGPLARKLKAESVLGRLLDHGADAVFVTAMLTALALNGWVTLWLPAAVSLAFAFYLFDHIFNQDKPRQQQIPHWFGKLNGVSYYVLAVIPLIQMTLAFHLIGRETLLWISWFSLIMTLILIIMGRWRLHY